jgi:hypothetical protein
MSELPGKPASGTVVVAVRRYSYTPVPSHCHAATGYQEPIATSRPYNGYTTCNAKLIHSLILLNARVISLAMFLHEATIPTPAMQKIRHLALTRLALQVR